MWEELVEDVFEGNGKKDKTGGWWFARGIGDITC